MIGHILLKGMISSRICPIGWHVLQEGMYYKR